MPVLTRLTWCGLSIVVPRMKAEKNALLAVAGLKPGLWAVLRKKTFLASEV